MPYLFYYQLFGRAINYSISKPFSSCILIELCTQEVIQKAEEPNKDLEIKIRKIFVSPFKMPC